MTAIASGRCISAPAPSPKHSGTRPDERAQRGHEDRPQAHRAGVGERVVERGAGGAPLFGAMQEEDAVLHHQPDEQDGAEQRRHVERRAGGGERGHAAGERDRRRRQDGERRGEAAELEDEHEQHQRHRGGERLGERDKGAALREPLAADLDRDARGSASCASRDSTSRDGAAEVEPFEARGHRAP